MIRLWRWLRGWQKCGLCDGTGAWGCYGIFQEVMTCPNCNGKGEVKR